MTGHRAFAGRSSALALGLALAAGPVSAGGLIVGNFAEPPGVIELDYEGGAGALPGSVAYGQVTPPAAGGAGHVVVRGRHPDKAVGDAACRVDVSGARVALALFSADTGGRLQCTSVAAAPSAKAGLQAVAATPVPMRLVHLSASAGAGRLAAYAPGGVYASPCSPVAESALGAYPGASSSFDVAAGTHDLAFVRRCQAGAVDIPAVLPAVVLTEGNPQAVLLVGTDASSDPSTSLRLVLVTETP
jgi:hypothetical protein